MEKNQMKILGIETSCDETAAAIIDATIDKISVLSSVVSSQVKLHARWGGVVPNLAAREHLKNILPVIESAMSQAKIRKSDIDLLAVTAGPGLIPALLVGTNAAKTLAYVWKKPFLGVHHIEGHIYANFIASQTSQAKNFVKFPVLCLVVSGGHTQLVLMKKHLNYDIIGETLDDAAGEAFDKVARILNLGYPGGPVIAQKAEDFKNKKNKSTIKLPRPMIASNDLNFSFSGLKTAVLYEVKKHPKILKDKKLIAEISHEFQQAVIDVLIGKTLKAAKKYNPKTIMLAGGVSANKELREQLKKAIKKNFLNIQYQIPDIKYSIDNAAMIAAAGYFRWKKTSVKKKMEARNNWKKINPEANLKLQ